MFIQRQSVADVPDDRVVSEMGKALGPDASVRLHRVPDSQEVDDDVLSLIGLAKPIDTSPVFAMRLVGCIGLREATGEGLVVVRKPACGETTPVQESRQRPDGERTTTETHEKNEIGLTIVVLRQRLIHLA